MQPFASWLGSVDEVEATFELRPGANGGAPSLGLSSVETTFTPEAPRGKEQAGDSQMESVSARPQASEGEPSSRMEQATASAAASWDSSGRQPRQNDALSMGQPAAILSEPADEAESRQKVSASGTATLVQTWCELPWWICIRCVEQGVGVHLGF